MTAKRFAAHALLWGGLATMIYGVYVLTGTGWTLLSGGFLVYAVGYDMVRRGRDWNEALAILAKVQAENAQLRAAGGQTAGEAFAATVTEMQRLRRN